MKNKKVTLRPIAGTRKRGKNHNEDIQLRNDEAINTLPKVFRAFLKYYWLNLDLYKNNEN